MSGNLKSKSFVQIENNHKKRNVCKSASSGKISLQACTTTLTTMETTMNDILGTAEITTSRSSSSSAIVASIRPQTLNVLNSREASNAEASHFIGEALNAWRAKAKSNVVPAERVQELFHELQFSPSETQINEMLKTAKGFTRKTRGNVNGLTFGEFCVLVADLKRFRTCSFSRPNDNTRSSLRDTQYEANCSERLSNFSGNLPRNQSTKSSFVSSKNLPSSYSSVNNSVHETATASVPEIALAPAASTPTKSASEVFLGGSCNPTTWRQDVAIPALKELGISFYNPQVSNWTPDLIDLEHQAKEKARVLFFVMDSETRASAGAIEAAHIAGKACKQLVLVLHPYKEDQCILKERISKQEYVDLSRNQQILRELVRRREYFVQIHDNILDALHKTKEILAGVREPPANTAAVLADVRRTFEFWARSSVEDDLSLEQCQKALTNLCYTNSLIKMENLKRIITSQKETLDLISERKSTNGEAIKTNIRVNFDEFCVLTAYLSVLQQEIHESGCISPIKGTNMAPPMVYLENMREGCVTEESIMVKHIWRTSSGTSVPDDICRGRDSGTSSPQPSELLRTKNHIGRWSKISLNFELSKQINSEINTEDESDSNDSVFSSEDSATISEPTYTDAEEFRDVYLGGSCYLRTNWRQDFAIPLFKSKGVTFHLPALHESIQPSQLPGHSQLIADTEADWSRAIRPTLFNPLLLDTSRVLLFVITNETRSLAPMTLAAHCIGLMYNVVLCVQMLPEFCIIGNEKLTPIAIKDYNRGRSYLIDLAKRQGVPVFNDLKSALECTVEKVKACNSRNSV